MHLNQQFELILFRSEQIRNSKKMDDLPLLTLTFPKVCMLGDIFLKNFIHLLSKTNTLGQFFFVPPFILAFAIPVHQLSDQLGKTSGRTF